MISISHFMNGQTNGHSALIGDGIAVFYPDHFDPGAHLPSFALAKEPTEKGAVPASWKTRVQFDTAFGKSIAYIDVDDDTDLYGTGEVTGPLARNGTTRKFWNTDNVVYFSRDNGLRLYQSHPWVIGVRKDGSSFGVLSDNTWKQQVSMGDGIVFSSAAPPFRVIVIEKDTPREVMQALAMLTGHMPLPPLWSLGYQQCRWSYYPDSRVKEIADTFRVKNIPCDVIWVDIHYMDQYKVFTFSPERFPDPEATNEYLHDKGFKAVWMIDPGVKKEKGYNVYDSGEKKDVWVKNSKGEPFVGKVWPGDCVFPDFTRSNTNTWWASLYKDFMSYGIDGVWNDMNEPSVFNGPGGTMPKDNIHVGNDTIPKGTHLRYHNVYGMLMVKASREGIKKANPDKRPFVLTRSNFLGGHRYAATWTGDNAATWKHLKLSVPMSLNLGLSGQPFNGPDIGGFGGNASPELFGHWIALGAFYPFSRAHTMKGTKNQEPWSFGKEIENVSRVAMQRRYRLLPYLYTLFHESSVNGMPVMRPAFFADIKDNRLRREEEAFLLGDDLYIIPKWAEEPRVPKGNWRTISLVGEDSKNDPYQPDIKLREGAILPLGNIIQNTTEYTLDTLTLYVSLDEKGVAYGKIYHDAGDGYAFQKGEYALATFKAEKKDDEVVIEKIEDKGDISLTPHVIKVSLIQDDQIIKGEGTGAGPVNINLSGQ